MTGHEGIDSMQETQPTLLDEARRDLEAKRNAQAIAKFREMVSRDPNNALAYQGLAQGLNRLRRYHEAEQASRAALELDPKLAIPHEILAFILAKRGQYAESRSEAESAIRLDPNAVSAFVTLGHLQVVEGQLQDAEESLKRAVLIDAGNFRAHYNLAICYWREKRFDESLHEAWQAFKLSPSADTGYMVALAFMQGRRRWVAYVVAGLLLVLLFTGRSLIALPGIILVVAFFLKGSVVAARSGNRSAAVFGFLYALLWVALYFFTRP
jgi:tetratricopeptide (TPR) repeat protein